MRIRATNIAIERQGRSLRRSLRDGHRHAKDGVGAKAGLVRRAVEIDQYPVDSPLVSRVHPQQFGKDLVIDRRDRLQHALAEVTRLVAIAQLHRLVRASRRARRHSCAAGRAIFEGHFRFDRRIAPAVEDFPRVDVHDLGHWLVPWV